MMMVAPTNNNNVPGSERTATRPASASISPSSYLDQSGGGGESDITGGGGGYNHWKNLENGHSMLYGRRSNSVGNLYSAGQDFYDHYHHPGLPQVPADKPIGHTAVKSSTERQPSTPTSSPRQR